MNQDPSHARPSGQGATILLLGFMILLLSCGLILTVRVHVRLGALTDELVKLNAKLNVPAKAPGGDAAVTAKDAAPTKAAAPVAGQTLAAGQQRSPIPQPGEDIQKPLLPARLGDIEPAQPLAPEPATGQIVPWDQAHLHMGRTITIEGKIVSTRRLATICFLNFTNEASGGDAFYLVVFKDQFDEWGGFPEQAFLNKTVRVTGKIEDHKGRPQLKINQKSQVEKLE